MPSEHENNSLETGGWSEIKDTTPPPTPKERIFDFAQSTISKIPFKDHLPRQKLGPTGYLDGLRGFCALLVYIQHQELWSRSGGLILENVFGWDNKYHFACLPGIRVFFTGGHIAVTVFFVMSGYVLSAKPLTYIQSGDHGKLAENVGSALFRRWIRLFLPVIATTFIYMTSWHLLGIWTESEEHEATFRAELWKYYVEFKNWSYIFQTGGEPWFTYNRHVWSIQVEMKGSIVIYTTLMAVSRCTRNARLWVECGLMFYFMYITDAAWMAMFICGMFLCDMDLLAKNGDLPRWLARLEPYKEIFYYHFFVIALYLAGVPSYDNNDGTVLGKSHGWYYLSLLKPQAVYDHKWFYLFWASGFMIVSIPRIPWLKRFFESRVNQYLGKISYSLYLVHGPAMRTLGDRMYVAVGWTKPRHAEGLPRYLNLLPLSKAGPYGLEFSLLAVNVILFPFTLYLADLTTRFIDKPSVRFAQWFYRKTVAPAGPNIKT